MRLLSLFDHYDGDMNEIFIVGVPTVDSDDLTKLSERLGTSQDFSEQRYFDGATFIEVIVPSVLSAAAWATLRAWIRARADVLKATRVAYRGVEITAMNAKDSERIINLLTANLTVDEDKADVVDE